VISSTSLSCPACDSRRIGRSTAFRDHLWIVYDCRDCGTSFVTLRLNASDLGAYYRRGPVLDQVDNPWTEEFAKRVEFHRTVVSLLSPYRAANSNLLDVGCSEGHLLEAAATLDWSGTGIEIDGPTASRTAARLGVVVVPGEGVQAMARLGEFGAIVMSHWLEHVQNPRDAVRIAAQHLVPGGALLVRVPCGTSRLARALGTAWSWYKPPVHLTYFSSRGLKALLEEAGIRVREFREWRGDSRSALVEEIAGFQRCLSAIVGRKGTAPVRLQRRGESLRASTFGVSSLAERIPWLNRLFDDSNDSEILMIGTRDELTSS
jgi:SAM-dependent methyltransferase